MVITVYSKPACPECLATKKYLDRKGLEYSVVDVTEDPGALEYVESLGYQSVPVVVAGDEHWSRFRLERIQKLTDRTCSVTATMSPDNEL